VIIPPLLIMKVSACLFFSALALLVCYVQEVFGFQPTTKAELVSAVNTSCSGDTSGSHNNLWDVSMMNDTSELFKANPTFNDDISN
jgi:hypothetical protein